MTVRCASQGEAAALARLHGGFFTRSWDQKYWSHALNDPGVHIFLIETEASLSGLVAIRVMADEAEILTIGVLPKLRSQGLAGQLLDQALIAASALGAGRMFLEVSVENTAARALYARRGFVMIGQRPRYYANGDDALVLSLDF